MLHLHAGWLTQQLASARAPHRFSSEAQQGDAQQDLYDDYYYALEGGIFKYFGMDEKGSALRSPMRSDAFQGDMQVRIA